MKTQCSYHLVIGLDRSDAKADLHHVEPASHKRWSQTLDTAPERLHDWHAQPRKDSPRARVAIGVDHPPTNLILLLEAYVWITPHAINPITLQKYAEALVTLRTQVTTRFVGRCIKGICDSSSPARRITLRKWDCPKNRPPLPGRSAVTKHAVPQTASLPCVDGFSPFRC